MSQLNIVSRDHAALRLRPQDRHYFVVEATSADLHCVIKVSSYESGGIPEYFGELAANWRGWKGSKFWQSLEEELTLEATSDRLGHIFLTATLRHGFDTWTAVVRLVVEAGQLDALATAAGDFGSSIHIH
jgi:hypothetical protein